MTETLLTVDEAAARLKLTPATLRRQLRAGQVRAVRTGKMWRIPESELEPKLATENKRIAMPVSTNTEVPTDLVALFAPPTAEEIALRLKALDTYGAANQTPKAEASEPDLSGSRGDVYGYGERESRQL